MNAPADSYPLRFAVDYPDRPLDRLTTFFRLFTVIPIGIVLANIDASFTMQYFSDSFFGWDQDKGWNRGASSGLGLLFIPILLMLLFRRKYPRWWFDFNLELLRFSTRVSAYLGLLRDEYPSTDEEQAVHLDIDYPDAEQDLNRWLPLIKWFLAIPHYIVLTLLGVVVLLCLIGAWFAILFTGHYPRALFDLVVGFNRWWLRVIAYAFILSHRPVPTLPAICLGLLMPAFSSLRLAASPSTRDAWEAQRPALLEAMQQIMGSLPGSEKRGLLDVQAQEETDCGSYTRRLITYVSEPDCRVPAYLLIPHAALESPAPAVLCPHPTDDRIGHKVVVGLGGRANRAYASELAQAGFVTLAPAYPLLADYRPDWRALGYQSGTMKAIWDNMRGLDLLAELPFVAGSSFASIGHSLGGHNSIYTAVFDPRIAAVVSSCGLDSYQDYMDGDITGWTSDRYMPRLKDYALPDLPFDFHDMIAALAPRPCFISTPLGDSNFRWRSAASVVETARAVYDLYGASEALQVVHPDCDHDFPDAIREQAYRVIAEALTTGD